MNRIILIGNGFDLAHDLKTSYTDFINSYWTEFAKHLYDNGTLKIHMDALTTCYISIDGSIRKSHGVFHTIKETGINILENGEKLDSFKSIEEILGRYKSQGHADIAPHFEFKNTFWGDISKKTTLQTWLDIENEYYDILCSKTQCLVHSIRNRS